MIQFLLAIPEIVLYGCGILIAIALAITIALLWQTWRVKSQIQVLAKALKEFNSDSPSRRRDGIALARLDEIRSRCEKLGPIPRAWWTVIDSHVE